MRRAVAIHICKRRRSPETGVGMTDINDLLFRFWPEIISRASGPFHFRFILQPITASILAVRDGIHDAREGRTPYIWSLVHEPDQRSRRLREGFAAVGRVIVLGIVMDGIYQYLVFDSFRPLQMLVVSLALAFLPYLLLRGPADRVARRWNARHAPPTNAPPIPRH